MRWPLIIYTHFGVPQGSAACARGPVIIIRPDYRGDEGLYRHELEHVRQAFVGLFVGHAVAYLMSPAYRLRCEVEAYRAQIAHNNPPRPDADVLYAGFIATKYDLDITVADALARLRATD